MYFYESGSWTEARNAVGVVPVSRRKYFTKFVASSKPSGAVKVGRTVQGVGRYAVGNADGELFAVTRRCRHPSGWCSSRESNSESNAPRIPTDVGGRSRTKNCSEDSQRTLPVRPKPISGTGGI